jgi:uncharacterized protein (TIGR02118 family)
MIRITILYPNRAGGRFDHAYYETVHVPMTMALLGEAVRSVCVERGLSPGSGWPEPAYRAACSFVCESLEAYRLALAPHLPQLQGDLVNYSDIDPVIQVGEIVLETTTGAGLPA